MTVISGRAQRLRRRFFDWLQEDPRRSRWALSLRTTLALCLLFFVAYGGTNLLSAHRAGIGSWVLPIDRHVPFVPLLIVPYMSIDLFFLAAPFACDDDRERRQLAGRMATAMLVAGSFFLAMPLKFAFDRPAGNALFDLFHKLDGPYNQFPSLHVAFVVIFAVHYHRHTHGPLRLALHAWLVLIVASTVLTFQHHVIDVAGGLALGWFCLFVFPDHGTGEHVNRRVAAYYTAATAFLVLAGALLRPWGAILLWPAVASGVMAAECFGTGAIAHRKTDGTVWLSTRFVMAPVRVGQWLSWRHYGRRSRAWDAVAEGVWLGRVLRPVEATEAVALGVSAVLDMTPDFDAALLFRDVDYLNLAVPDLTAPSAEQLSAAAAFIGRHRAAGRTVYVFCKAGYSRSAAAVAAYLVTSGLASSAEDAIAQMTRSRPGLIVRPEARAAINSVTATSGPASTGRP